MFFGMKLYKKSQLKSKIQPNKKIFVNFLVEFMKMSQPKSKLGGEKVFFWVTFKNSKKSQEKSKLNRAKIFVGRIRKNESTKVKNLVVQKFF